MDKITKVIGFSGSIRSNYKHIQELEGLIRKASSKKDLDAWLGTMPVTYSNTDISIAYALLGAKEAGASIKFISLLKMFKHVDEKIFTDSKYHEHVISNDIENIDTLSIGERERDSLMDEVQSADGIILGSPVYFGDRSSVANKLLQLTNKKRLLRGKAFGCVSVGAKRNGGQETTIIYLLYEALMQNAVVVGNGPKTSQYGGTAFAGDPHKILKDDFGIETCYNTGKRVANLAAILKNGKDCNKKTALNITVLLTMDMRNKEYETIVKDYFSKYSNNCNIDIINLTDYNFYRCVACSICPSPAIKELNKNKETSYNCIVQTKKDSMKSLYEILLKSDCLVIAGVNSSNNLLYRYQAFMERTRFIRRGDFELTNTPIVGLLINEAGSINNPLHNLKVLTSYIRHNTFVMKPIEIVYHNGVKILQNDFWECIEMLKFIKNGRQLVGSITVSYEATGYGDRSLDNTSAIRR